ncbi:hypothetical protein H0I23_01230 [Cellulophaga sp. HaHaR_3_176]|uniref:hypothetical protein n=1 Tax=Cellulophaga sp. HaHaR_3_176 TaxID=1942464 RepID=UPI001C1FC5E7|nr:hypothetical protein [Cellulophaga sp. HaHaR_3_176]QWX84305.1 hypothetical protein H0I23_01230 [Cellulophaga sp. HaHaR_3_176]
MKKITSLALLFVLIVVSCKDDKKQEETAAIPKVEKTILEKVAFAHGFENWKKVNEIKFTFNVERDTTHFERDWIWHIKENDVTAKDAKETIRYNRNLLDSITKKTNGGFINDKFWLLAPYQLIWDQNNFKYEHATTTEAPISKNQMQKLTIVYSNEGGYTPGDAYDFYFNDDYIIKEWVFRKGNQTEPSMATTWEDYKELNGLKIAQTHKNAEGNFNLHFTGLEVK